MSKVDIEKLGPSVVVHMNFTTEEGVSSKDMKPGQYVIIYGEIPARKLHGDAFMVYPDCPIVEVEDMEQKAKEMAKKLNKELEFIRQEDFYYSEPKYIRTKKGGKRIRPWEPNLYF